MIIANLFIVFNYKSFMCLTQSFKLMGFMSLIPKFSLKLVYLIKNFKLMHNGICILCILKFIKGSLFSFFIFNVKLVFLPKKRYNNYEIFVAYILGLII